MTMTMTIRVADGQQNRTLTGVTNFEEITGDGVIVDFADGTSAEFDSVWAGSLSNE